MQRYSASITREPFLFYEMRLTAGLMAEGLSDAQIVQKITSENLYQYPTERSLSGRARACLRRLRGIEDEALVSLICRSASLEARQAALYAWMADSRLVAEFMTSLIGMKYKRQDRSFSAADARAFFFQLQEQNDQVASWRESTMQKIRQVLVRMLIETGYLDSPRAGQLHMVWLTPFLKERIIAHGHRDFLPAFHCLEEE